MISWAHPKKINALFLLPHTIKVNLSLVSLLVGICRHWWSLCSYSLSFVIGSLAVPKMFQATRWWLDISNALS